MKRFVLSLVVVLVLAGLFFLQRQLTPRTRQVAAWLPAGTVFLENTPNLHRSEERWGETALAEIIHEPELQAFLERPMRSVPGRAELDQRMEQLGKIDPTQFFFAVTEMGDAPKAVAGLSFSGSRQELDSLLGELRKSVQEQWPEGKPDIERYGSGEIETFTTPGFSAGLAYRGRWLFIATDTGLLKATLDRYEARPAPDSLAKLPAFQNCLQHLPSAPDNVLYLRPVFLADKAASLSLLVNPNGDAHEADGLKKIDAVCVATKMDGELVRDAAYFITSSPGDTTPLAKDTLKLSTPDTIVAVSDRMQPPANIQIPDSKQDPTGLVQLLESYAKIFGDQGLGIEQIAQAFGPESGFLLDWPAGSIIPTPLAVLDVRDAIKARKFLDTLATLPIAAGVSFAKQEAGGIAFYSLPETGIGFFPLQVTIGLTPKCAVAALNMDSVKQAAKRWDAGGAGLAGTAAYQKASTLVTAPTVSFSYVDSKAIFERLYGLFRSVASMGFVPHLSDYVDIEKLPAPETISRHLSPMVSSVAVKDGGLLMESAGPVTTIQAVMVGVFGAGAAAIPLIEQEMKGQSVAIPGLSSFGAAPFGSGAGSFASPWVQGTPGGSTAPAPSPAQTPVPAAASPSAGTP